MPGHQADLARRFPQPYNAPWLEGLVSAATVVIITATNSGTWTQITGEGASAVLDFQLNRCCHAVRSSANSAGCASRTFAQK